MKPVVAINEPCHESWEKMTPQEQGRHCDQCCKVVVDFTQMSNGAIADYLKAKTSEKVCGRFREEQVIDLPAHRIRFGFKLQRFAAAVFLAFGSFLFASCGITKPHDPQVMGDVAYIPDTVVTTAGNTKSTPVPDDDTVKTVIRDLVPEQPENHKLGEVSLVPDTTISIEPEHTLMGGVTYVPDEEDVPVNCVKNVPDTVGEVKAPQPAPVIMGAVKYVPPKSDTKPK